MTDPLIRILLIEDDRFDAFVTEHYLKKGHLNYRLKIAHSGADAFAYLKLHVPDLILVDIGLPDMDGREILKKLGDDPRTSKIPLIVLTGQTLEENPVRKFNLYEHAYLNKWVNMVDFISLITAVADQRSSVK